MSRPKSGSSARRSRLVWQGLVATWRTSRLTAVEFGAQHGVDPARLRWWRWYLRQPQSSVPQPAPAAPVVQLVELPPAADDRLELSLGGARLLRFSAAIDANQLTRLVRAIEGSS